MSHAHVLQFAGQAAHAFIYNSPVRENALNDRSSYVSLLIFRLSGPNPVPNLRHAPKHTAEIVADIRRIGADLSFIGRSYCM